MNKKIKIIIFLLPIFLIALFSFIFLNITSGKYGCKGNRFSLSILLGRPCQMMLPLYRICDLNQDGKCNEIDKNIFDSSFGSCRGQKSYNLNADIDVDGCIVSADKDMFTNSMDEK